MDSNRISRQVEEYITYKQSLGYMIKIESQELRRFAKYTREIGYDGPVKSEIAMEWASIDKNFTRKYMARRLETIHTFAVYISAFGEYIISFFELSKRFFFVCSVALRRHRTHFFTYFFFSLN